MKKILSCLLALILVFSSVSTASVYTSGAAASAEIFSVENTELKLNKTGTTKSELLAQMRERAEAFVNYEWVPSTDIAVWNENPYNGKMYFPAGETVKGVPYTLFFNELNVDSLLSLEEYKSKASINYSTTTFCTSMNATRTGPVYGSCCATFVSEVFGGNFVSGISPKYDSVPKIINSGYCKTTYGVKAANIEAGDALSNISGGHIVWVGEVTDTYITIYEETPPIARKVTLPFDEYVFSDGYLHYGDSTNEKSNIYNVVTKSNELSATADNSEPVYTKATSNIVINGVDIGYANNSYFTKNGKSCKNSYWSSGRCHKNGVCEAATHSQCNCMRYWPTGNPSTCKVDLLSSQCFGFARYCQYIVYGYHDGNKSSYFTNITGTISSANCTASNLKSKLLNCAPATHIRTSSSVKGYGHSISVVSTSDSGITFADCNSDGYCVVRSVTQTWAGLASFLKSYGGISYAYSWNQGGASTHTHSYSKNYEAAHPHKVYMKCSCGDYYYTGETTFVASCSSCNNTSTVSTYPTPFKGYTISTGKTQVSSVNGSMTAKTNKIYSTDECTVDKVYSNGWCHVTFPLDAGGTDNGYVPLSTFLNTSYSVSTTTVGSQTTTYRRSDGGTNYGYIGSGDTVTKVGSSGSYTQIIYPLSGGGYKVAWAILPTQTDPVGSSVGCAENWTVTAKSGLKCRVSPGSSAAETVSGYGMGYGKEIIIAKKQYDSAGNLWGWGHGYNSSLGRNLEGWYCLTYANYNYSYVPSVVSVSISPAAYPDKTVITWTAADRATHYDVYIDGNCVERNNTSRSYNVALQSGSHSVKIAAVNSDFPYINSYDCYSITNAISFTTTAKQYTVSYDANGGNGAPSKQTKTHNANLKLSSVVPSRQGYSFLGWAADSSATSPTYSSGATYSKNDSITLYAVWSCSHPYDSGKITAEATCTSTGTRIYTCTNCGKTKTETIAKDSSNHTGGTTIKNTKSATCSSEGYTGDEYCLGCGAKLSTGQAITKTAHSYDSGKVTTAPTCESKGVKTYTCTVCKTTKTESVSALGHDFTGASRTNSDGSVSYKCTRCNEYGKTNSLTKIAVESMPSKTVYNIGESLNTSGLKLKLTYGDASTKSIASGFTVTGFNSSTAGTKTVTVTYGNKTTNFKVTVNSVTVDESSAQITVDSVKATAGKTVQLSVKLKNNPGIAGLSISLDYNKNALTLTNTSNGSLFDSFTSGKNFMWDSVSNITTDGTLATFTFKVNEKAAKGDYSVGVIVRSCADKSGADITLNSVNGKISVIDFVYGDANGDSKIDTKDVVLLRQYLANYDYDTNTSSVTIASGADANGDNKIDMKDVVILRQYLAYYDYDTNSSTVVLGPQ